MQHILTNFKGNVLDIERNKLGTANYKPLINKKTSSCSTAKSFLGSCNGLHDVSEYLRHTSIGWLRVHRIKKGKNLRSYVREGNKCYTLILELLCYSQWEWIIFISNFSCFFLRCVIMGLLLMVVLIAVTASFLITLAPWIIRENEKDPAN